MTPTEHSHGTDRAAARDACLPTDPGIGLDLSLSRQRGGFTRAGRLARASWLPRRYAWAGGAIFIFHDYNNAETDRSGAGEPVRLPPTQDRQPQGEAPASHGHDAVLGEVARSHLPGRPRAGHGPDQARGGAHVGQPSPGVRLEDRRLILALPPADASSVGPAVLVAGGERAPLTPLCMGVGHGDGMRSGTSFAIARPGNRCAVAHWTSVNANAAFQGDRRMRGADSGVTAGETAPHRRVAQSAEPLGRWFESSPDVQSSGKMLRRIEVGHQHGSQGASLPAHPAPGRRGELSGDADPQWATVDATASGWGPPLSMQPPFFFGISPGRLTGRTLRRSRRVAKTRRRDAVMKVRILPWGPVLARLCMPDTWNRRASRRGVRTDPPMPAGGGRR